LLSTPAGDQAADRAMDSGAAPPFGAQPTGTEPPRRVSGIFSPQPPETLQNRIPEWAHNPVWTAYAGLFFLLPMMSRLGIEDWLKRNPQLIEMEFPVRLLRAVAERMSISPDDGAWSALSLSAAGAGDEPTVANDLGGFVAPRRWQPALCRSGTLLINRFDGAPGRRILSDSSQRLALAMWRGAAPDEAREIINGASIKRGRTVRPHDALSILLESWLTAMRRWCRRYTGMGLVEIARRPGLIVVTRTHLDLLFDLRQSDARIRRAGLDLNPGWIPWLAKVVTFHYLYGDD
jgi:hypothetical protein